MNPAALDSYCLAKSILTCHKDDHYSIHTKILSGVDRIFEE